MNKTLLLILAICLVSVHAFAKRDAPQDSAPSITDQAQKGLGDFVEGLKQFFDPEKLKKAGNDLLESANNALNSLKPTEAPKA